MFEKARSARGRDRKALEFIENVTSKAEEVQREVLSAILTTDANTEYLQSYGLNGSSDREAFKKALPLITYNDLKPHIQRIADGDTSPILCALPVTEFLRSSGTSEGEPKMLPTNTDYAEKRNLFFGLVRAVRNQYVEELGDWNTLHFIFVRDEMKTAGGLVYRSATTSLYKSQRFRDAFHCNLYTSPIECILCTDVYESMYSQLLCALLHRKQVMRMGALFANGFLMAIRVLEQHWTQLCFHIESGILNKEIRDPFVREAVTKILQPDPNLAQLIRSECSNGRWEGTIRRLWPNAKYIDVIVTVPFGINLEPLCNPEDVSYTLLPNMGYFEFLPLRKGESDEQDPQDDEELQELVNLVDVEVGQIYELVVTTYTGLYHYRMGDILLVTGFHNEAPQFQFVCKKNVLLSIDFDNTRA
ncbi:hypothetical protein SUGI_0526070 [Cryptomeria japonica]|nr:hypothetical protein SUGI_0526070 [Cryptomeria japonica]